MMRDVRVDLLPTLLEPAELRGGVAVVIDVLRASTTICHALAAGAGAVVPFESLEETRRFAASNTDHKILLGGERDGRRIEGFDLDNSPASYTPEIVSGRMIAFTTTNGTRALLRCRQAEQVLLAAFVNVQAVVDRLLSSSESFHLVCAGTDGKVTAEDVLCAGAILDRLLNVGRIEECRDDAARIALDFFGIHSENQESLIQAVSRSQGGRNLRARGFAEDIQRAAEVDRFNLVPVYSAHSGQIQAAGDR